MSGPYTSTAVATPRIPEAAGMTFGVYAEALRATHGPDAIPGGSGGGTKVPTRIHLAPDGEFGSHDGRPQIFGSPAWRMNAVNAALVIARFQARKLKGLIDYEHQTLEAQKNGQAAPAAGWYSTLEFVPGQGLYATGLKWTAKATGFLENDEYAYASPVFLFNPETGDVVDLLHIGLTNFPGLNVIDPLVALRAAEGAAASQPSPTPETLTDMTLLQRLLAALGLPATTSEDTVATAVTALKAKADAAATEVAALTARANATPDPAQYVPISAVTALRDEVAALKSSTTESEVTRLVDAGMADGRLPASMKDWATSLGKKDLVALRGYLDSAPKVAALAGQQSGQSGAGIGGGELPALTSDEVAACKAMGLDQAAFAATKAGRPLPKAGA